MSKNNDPKQQKTLLAVLVVVIIVAVGYLLYSTLAGGSGGAASVDNVPKVPPDITPVTEEEMSRVPGPVDYGTGKPTTR
jgi:hypothetical protein